MRRLLAFAAVIVVAILAGVVVAQATIPSADGTITGCYHNSTGALRVIDGDTATCPSGQTELTWNQSGPAGPAGPLGYYIVNQVSSQSGPDAARIPRCGTGDVALGGGGGVVRSDGVQTPPGGPWEQIVLQSSNPADVDGDGVWEGWHVQVHNFGDPSQVFELRAWVICAPAT